MMTKRIFAAAGVLAGALMFGGAAFAADVSIKYAHPTSNASLGGQMAIEFKRVVEEASGGEIEVTIFPDGQLGELSEMNELAASGAIQMSNNTWGSLGVFLDEAGGLDSPYLWRSPSQALSVLNNPESTIVARVNNGLEENGSNLHVLAATSSVGRQVSCDREVFSPEDLDGVKFRAIPFPVFIATVKGMGAVPLPIEYVNLPLALASGEVNCQENPLNNIVTAKMYENQSHIMMTNHIIAGGPVLINADFYNGLTEQQQMWISEAARDAAFYQGEIAEEVEAENRAFLEGEGVTFIEADDGLQLDVFAERVAVEFAAEFGDRYTEIINLVHEERATLGQM